MHEKRSSTRSSNSFACFFHYSRFAFQSSPSLISFHFVFFYHFLSIFPIFSRFLSYVVFFRAFSSWHKQHTDKTVLAIVNQKRSIAQTQFHLVLFTFFTTKLENKQIMCVCFFCSVPIPIDWSHSLFQSYLRPENRWLLFIVILIYIFASPFRWARENEEYLTFHENQFSDSFCNNIWNMMHFQQQ